MDPLRNYLAWQSELGGDEVLLAAPYQVSARMTQHSAAAPATSVSATATSILAPGPVFERSPSPAPVVAALPPAGGSLFEMLAKSLEDSNETAKAGRTRGLGLAEPAAAPKPGENALPAFPDLKACRDHLERNLRSLHTGEAPAAEAKVVHGAGPDFAPLALVAMEPSIDDARAGLPFQGEGGMLLEKMMRAIKLDLGSLYRTYVVKLPGGSAGRKSYTRRDLVRLLPLFHAELELARVPVVLLLGEACAQAVLKTGKGLDELRQTPHRLDGVPGREFAVTWHPDELNGNDELKRKAWKDLQWLQPRLQGNAGWN